jgi:hypothetical protein
MGETNVDPVAILEGYYAKFGEGGDFDRWLLGGETNLRLMQEALRRGSPVTPRDVQRAYRELTGEDVPDFPKDADR